jgi:GR25 family glycosyltransferase involved in LPS biosynthesis
MKVFVIHYKELVERKKNILKQFEKYNIKNYEFIEIDRREINNYNIEMFNKNLPNAQIAITLSHIYAYKQVKDNYDYALILEDDVILSDYFTEILMVYLKQLPHDYDMLFIGNGCNLHIENNKLIKNKFIYKKCLYPTHWGGNGATRCVDSYLISKKFATNICKYIDNLNYKINESIDWWLNKACRDNNFIVYWAEPTIVCQGSQNGLFSSCY